jgi:hypothetical protein
MIIGELFAIREGKCLSSTLDDRIVVLINDVEGVAG